MDVDGTGNSSSRSGDHLRPPAQSGNVDDDRDLSQSGVMSRAQQKRPTPTQLTETEQETCLEDLQQLLEEIEGRVRRRFSSAHGSSKDPLMMCLTRTQNHELSELMDETSAILLSRTLAVCCTSDKTAEKSMELTSRLIKAILKALPAFYGHRSSKDTHPPWVFENQWKAHGEAFENLLWLIGCGIVVSAVKTWCSSACTCETHPDRRTVLASPAERLQSTHSQVGTGRQVLQQFLQAASRRLRQHPHGRAGMQAFPLRPTRGKQAICCLLTLKLRLGG